MTFQAKSYQFGTDVVLQYQKDGGDWTPFLSEARNTQTEFETYTVSGLEAGTYRFRIRTENIYLDNFEGFTLAPSTAVKETWLISYTFHYQNGGSEETLSDVEQMEIEFDGDNIAFNFPNPITGNAWMHGAKYQGEGPETYIFPNGQYIGMYNGEQIYFCGSNGEALTDMVFYYNDEEKAFYDALSSPEGIKEAYSSEQFKALTVALTEQLRKNRTIDWNKKDSARASMRRIIKRLLREYHYPPEGYEQALSTVMQQCERWAEDESHLA
jgi:hypothetical protein